MPSDPVHETLSTNFLLKPSIQNSVPVDVTSVQRCTSAFDRNGETEYPPFGRVRS